MSILDATDIMVWREQPPSWSHDRWRWNRVLGAGEEPTLCTVMARCYGHECRTCCVTNTDSVCWCGAAFAPRPDLASITTEVRLCPSCGTRIIMCHRGVSGLSVPLIQSSPEDII